MNSTERAPRRPPSRGGGGPSSQAGFLRQPLRRQRLAWHHEPDELARSLAELTDPPWPPSPATPRDGAELRAELMWRAESAGHACATELSPGGSNAVAVDTHGPRVIVTGASGPSAECLGRAVRARFRSLDPAHVIFELRPQ